VEKYLASSTVIAWSTSLSGKERRKCSKLCETVPVASIDNPSIQNDCHQLPNRRPCAHPAAVRPASRGDRDHQRHQYLVHDLSIDAIDKFCLRSITPTPVELEELQSSVDAYPMEPTLHHS
jgi:hypothetical protein